MGVLAAERDDPTSDELAKFSDVAVDLAGREKSSDMAPFREAVVLGVERGHVLGQQLADQHRVQLAVAQMIGLREKDVHAGKGLDRHPQGRTTKDIDMLVDPSDENLRAVKRALARLPDNAAADVNDDDVRRYSVVRLLIRTKQTLRESDRIDVRFLTCRLEKER